MMCRWTSHAVLVSLALAFGCAQSSDRPEAGATPTEIAASGERLDVPGGLPVELGRIAGSARDGVPRAFLIGRFEITHAQFEPFIRATHYDGADHPSSKSTEPFLADWKDERPAVGAANDPVCYLNVHHAAAFCGWLSRVTGRTVRLPTDAEWSLAAMGPGLARTYPWGDAWDPECANIGGDADGFPAAAPVGSFPRGCTPDGLFDMAGNIWEWTSTPTDGDAARRERVAISYHLRGGPWCMGEEAVRSNHIAREDPDRADDKFGLRIVVEAP